MTSLENGELGHYFRPNPLMIILRNLGPGKSVELAKQAWGLGIFLVEITLQTPRDKESLMAVVEAANGDNRVIIAAGTVTTGEDAASAAEAGANFTVSPGLDLAVARDSHSRGLPHLPGVATPTEVHRALEVGMTWMKAFPAAHLGESWFRALLGPFPEVNFIATGGITIQKAQSFLSAGCVSVALGSALGSEKELRALSAMIPNLKRPHLREGGAS